MHPTILFGPPGTGKTTTMMELMQKEIERGVSPSEIGFVSFTKKAANEAKERAMKKFNLQEEQFPWCRTLHSTAFRTLGYNTKQTMKKYDYRSIGHMLGVAVSGHSMNEDGQITWGNEIGDRLFSMIDFARNKCVPLRELWEEWPDEDIIWGELERASVTLQEYKENKLLVDYVDMIQQFVLKKRPPQLRVLFVDEAQDLKNLEWQMVKVMAEGLEKVYIAGDDDQAIYKWAGADVEQFINMPGEKQVLGQSYRVPSLIAEIAQGIINRVAVRHPKQWAPREDKGSVTWHSPDEGIDMAQGTWLVLARNRYLLQKWHEECVRQGYSFASLLGEPIREKSIIAIKLWETLRKGEKLTPEQCISVYDMMSVKLGYVHGNKVKFERCSKGDRFNIDDLKRNFGLLRDDIWHDALDKISEEEREFMLAARRRGESLNEKPRIKLSTIHGAKGGEADSVVLITDMAPRHVKEMAVDPDSEHRVWYVAVTRAKQNLHIIQPSTFNFYDVGN
jgi:DNA helicase-2/ATP-dependent DNA helicase PcrA